MDTLPPRDLPCVPQETRPSAAPVSDGMGEGQDISRAGLVPASEDEVIAALGRLAEIGFARWER